MAGSAFIDFRNVTSLPLSTRYGTQWQRPDQMRHLNHICTDVGGRTRAEDGGARGVGTATGLPLPRFVSLKADEVNARVGPGGDYQIAWVFRRAGLPVEVWPNPRTGGRFATRAAARAGSTPGSPARGARPWLRRGSRIARFLSSPRRGAAPRRWRGSNPARSSMSCIATARTARFRRQPKGWVPQKNLWGVYPREKVK